MTDDDLNPTSALYWLPRLAVVDVPKPKTEIVAVEPMEALGLMYLCDEHRGDRETDEHKGCTSRLERYIPLISEAVGRVGGYPAFLRTDLFSGKHQYERTCYLPKPPNGDGPLLVVHAMALLEAQEMAFFPPPPGDTSVRAFLVRELLDIAPVFKAFGGLPITSERRYFIRDGAVTCHHPYWEDEQNIEVGLRGYSNARMPEHWRDKLRAVNLETPAEVEVLTERSQMVADVIAGEWSVDWMRVRGGEWYLIDMAVASESWHPDHDRAPRP